jgi:tetratricopeptide (TPR) repeat protein
MTACPSVAKSGARRDAYLIGVRVGLTPVASLAMIDVAARSSERGASVVLRTVAWASRVSLVICALGLSLSPVVNAAAADDEAQKKAARSLANGGMVAYQAGDYKAAEENLSRAFAAFPAPTLALWSARALEKLGKLVEAEDRYRAAERASVNAGEPEAQRKAKLDARKARAELLPRIPTLKISVEGAPLAGVIVRVDGVAIASERLAQPILVNPGERLITAERGASMVEAKANIASGEHEHVALKFEESASPNEALDAYLSNPKAEPPTRPSSSGDASSSHDWAMSSDSPGWRAVGWAAVGLGGAGLVTSAVLAAVANGKRSDFEDQCPDNKCPLGVPDSVRDDVNSYNSLRDLSTVGWIAGGALMVGGIGLLIALPAGGGRLSAEVAPGKFTLHGHF